MRILGAITVTVLALATLRPLTGDDTADKSRPLTQADVTGTEFFEKRVRPLLAENCYQCHGDKRQRGGLRLDSVAAILKGGDRGPAVIPGNPEQSLVIHAVRYGDEPRMPPTGKLKETQVADLTAWVKMGAPGPRAAALPSIAAGKGDFDLAERRKHWAYQPVRKPPLFAVKDAGWCTSPIDFFILAKLEVAGLTPAPAADRRTLIRRVTFDLIGLPPTPAEVEAFLADRAPDAFEKVVDRLLASPHYGERWGRHWLDVVRYAESLGFEFDFDLWNAWRYRDYVIRAFNDDLPYDQFVVEHLAGDLLPQPRRNKQGFNESILATGFYWMGEGRQNPVDIRQEQGDQIENQIDVLSKAFLAQTVACARCHDHKFDAVSTKDYYALVGYLKSSRYQQAFIDPPERIQAKVRQLAALKAQIRAQVEAELAPAWIEQLGSASRYLRAAARARGKDGVALAEVARTAGVDFARLQAWVKALEAKDLSEGSHPLHVWRQLVQGEPSRESIGRGAEQRALQALREKRDRALRATQAAQTFEDFRRDGYEGWHITGDAFTQPARIGDIIIGDKPQRPVVGFASSGAHSGLISTRLQGELRSATFTINKRYIHYRLAGRDARVNLYIDGYTLLMNPMHGKLTVVPASERLHWQTTAVDRWLGDRAYIEIRDSSIPMHRLNPPPSTGLVPDGPLDGYIVLDRVVFSDNPEPPPDATNRVNSEVLERALAGMDDLATGLAAAYQEAMLHELKRWRTGHAETADGVALLNWLLENGLLDRESDGKTSKLVQEYRALEAALPKPTRAPAIADGTGEDEFVHLRGNYKTLGERAPRRPPEALSVALAAGSGDPRRALGAGLPTPPPPSTGSGRLELARRLVDPANPLIARVMVNRIWQHHFGAGIVRTPDDFGRMGQLPTHPELLDYLTTEFVGRGWSVKAMHRVMVLSSAYRMSSVPDDGKATLDPENRLLHRMPLRRLEAEAIRDSILAVSGRLDKTVYGPSVMPHLTPYMEGRGRPSPGPLDGAGRRSLYISARRNFPTPMLVAFDFPGSFSTVGRRGVTTAPAQALTLMNDPFVLQQAKQWAQRIVADPAKPPEERVHELYQAAFARSPNAAELQSAVRFVERQAERGVEAWADLCHVLMNVKEFIFVE